MKWSSVVAVVLMNLGIVALVGFALWLTHTPWVLLGLIFMFATKSTTVNTKCPKCGHAFVAVACDDDEEDEGVAPEKAE